jgi:hypothetical protein
MLPSTSSAGTPARFPARPVLRSSSATTRSMPGRPASSQPALFGGDRQVQVTGAGHQPPHAEALRGHLARLPAHRQPQGMGARARTGDGHATASGKPGWHPPASGLAARRPDRRVPAPSRLTCGEMGRPGPPGRWSRVRSARPGRAPASRAPPAAVLARMRPVHGSAWPAVRPDGSRVFPAVARPGTAGVGLRSGAPGAAARLGTAGASRSPGVAVGCS